MGQPPHIHHREEETFYLQQGTLTIQVGGKAQVASPGDFICLPRGVAHSFQNTGNVEAKFLLVAVPAGLERFFEERTKISFSVKRVWVQVPPG